jgi:RHS repeat-associated protein
VINGTTTGFLYDGDALAAEYNGSGAVLRRYVHGPEVDNPLAWFEGSAVTSADANYLIADRQGSVAGVASAAGTLTANDTYDAYGAPNAWGTVGTAPRFRYTGQIAIPEAQLYYYKARVYDPVSGKFLQTDPIGDRDDLNLYAYVGDDPLDASDPTGEAVTAFGGPGSQEVQVSLGPMAFANGGPQANAKGPGTSGAQGGPGETSATSAASHIGANGARKFEVAWGPEDERDETRGVENEGKEIAGAAYTGEYNYYEVRLRSVDANNQEFSSARPNDWTATNADVESIKEAYAKAVVTEAERIANGHGFGKHAAEFGITTKGQYEEIELKTMTQNTPRQLAGGRWAYYNVGSNSLVIINPRAESTLFKPTDGLAYYLFELK